MISPAKSCDERKVGSIGESIEARIEHQHSPEEAWSDRKAMMDAMDKGLEAQLENLTMAGRGTPCRRSSGNPDRNT